MLTEINSEITLKSGRVIFCPIFPDIRIIVSFEGYQVSSPCPSDESRVVTRMSMGFGWKDTDRVKLQYSEKNLSRCHFSNGLGRNRTRTSVVELNII